MVVAEHTGQLLKIRPCKHYVQELKDNFMVHYAVNPNVKATTEQHAQVYGAGTKTITPYNMGNDS
jgi:hypothetical protein